jgi:hypothetical protein
MSVYPLTATETQLDFVERYEPPLGIVGGALDATVGHRIAQASVHRVITDVAKYLREHVKWLHFTRQLSKRNQDAGHTRVKVPVPKLPALC